ncbi:MAG: XcyI family restriction endonuclease [bacterium]
MKKSIEEVSTTIAGKKRKQRVIRLTNDWRIIFSSEPDVAIRDNQQILQVAIEIKGSMDKAGAQTRYGEAKKSFGKALSKILVVRRSIWQAALRNLCLTKLRWMVKSEKYTI